MEGKRVRRTGAVSQPHVVPSINDLDADKMNRLSVRQRKKRRKRFSESEPQNKIQQRSLSLSLVIERVLSKSPSVPEIRISPPSETNEYPESPKGSKERVKKRSFNDAGSLLKKKKSVNDAGSMLAQKRSVYDKNGPLSLVTTNWINETEDASSKTLQQHKGQSGKQETTSDNESEESSPTVIDNCYEDEFSYSTDEEEMKELYNQMIHYIRNDGCKQLRSLLKKQMIDVNVLLEDGVSLLHEASYKGCVTCIKTLLKFGSYVNLSDDLGFTPLHAAVLGLNYDAIGLLVRYNALPNLRNNEGLSSCHMGVLTDDVHVIHELMIGNGDPLLASDMYPTSPLQMAIDMKKNDALSYFLNMPSMLVVDD